MLETVVEDFLSSPTFWGFWLAIHLRWPEWRTRPESKGSCWNRHAVNYCTKDSDILNGRHYCQCRLLKLATSKNRTFYLVLWMSQFWGISLKTYMCACLYVCVCVMENKNTSAFKFTFLRMISALTFTPNLFYSLTYKHTVLCITFCIYKLWKKKELLFRISSIEIACMQDGTQYTSFWVALTCHYRLMRKWYMCEPLMNLYIGQTFLQTITLTAGACWCYVYILYFAQRAD